MGSPIKLERNIKIADMLTYTIYHLIFPIDKQECCGTGKNFWCSDYWHIEVLKCLYLGDDVYLTDPIPRRLADNTNFSVKDAIIYAAMKRKMLSCLIQLKDSCSSLFIPQIGRGIDLLLANMIKTWEHVYCFDYADHEAHLKEVFPENQIHFVQIAEGNHMGGYSLGQIKEKSIAIVNKKFFRDVEVNNLFSLDNIVHVIHQGDISENPFENK